MRSVKGIWRGRLYFPMDSLPHAAFLVGLSKTESTNGTSVIPLNPLPLLLCMKLTQWWH
jgi:phage terminase large subunit-like protein